MASGWPRGSPGRYSARKQRRTESGRFFRDTNRAVLPLSEPTDEANRCNLRHVTPKTLQKALYVGFSEVDRPLQVVWRDMKLQCLLLKYGQFISKPCVSPQVFYGSRRLTRCVLGSEAFRTMEQTWESQSGGALESDDTVKTK